MNLEKTGFCWFCGRLCGDSLFCNSKHEAAYKREKERAERGREGRKGGYGLLGNMTKGGN